MSDWPVDVSDEALLARFRAGDDRALELLFARYRRFAFARGRSYFLIGGDAEDLRQEALIGLFKAARDFRPEVGASFRSFAELCITRQLVSAVKAATRKKHAALNTYVSLVGSDTRGADLDYDFAISDDYSLNPEDEVVGRDAARELRATIQSLLSAMELEVLELYVEGMSYAEISRALGHQGKAVSNALYRIKRKLTDCTALARSDVELAAS